MRRSWMRVVAAAAAAACGGGGDAREGVPDTVVYVRVDTAGVQVPAELAGFCAPGPSSMQPADTVPSAAAGAGDTVPARTVLREFYGAPGQPVRCVVRRKQDLVTVWSAVGRNPAVAPVPKVDFQTTMLLVAGMGSMPSTDWSIGISAVHRTPDGLVATVTQYPPPGCFAGQSITQPVHIVSVPRNPAPVRFIEKAGYRSSCEDF